MTRTAAIVQARLGSTRLTGKALLAIGGRSMLERVVERLRRVRHISLVAIATTTNDHDSAIVAEAARLSVRAIRGSEDDVLGRYDRAALELDADVIVRITSDCPLIDPGLVDLVVASFESAFPPVAYASNALERTYPRGLDVEVFSRSALEHAAAEATLPHEREHVTPYLYQHPQRFSLLSVRNPVDCSGYRWTVDTEADLELVRAIYARLGHDRAFGWHEVMHLLEREPRLAAINSHIEQKPLIPAPPTGGS